jgi:hypothetical protein
MARTKKASAQQLLKQHLRVQRAQYIAKTESQRLRELAGAAPFVSELVQSEGVIYRVSTGHQNPYNAGVAVERVGTVFDLEKVIK